MGYSKTRHLNEYSENLRDRVINNKKYFREVLATYRFNTDNRAGSGMQLVAYMLKPGGSIEREIHEKTTQFIYVESGMGISVIEGQKERGTTDDESADPSARYRTYELSPGMCLIIPPMTYHYVHNDGKEDLKMFSIYVPGEFGPNRKDPIF